MNQLLLVNKGIKIDIFGRKGQSYNIIKFYNQNYSTALFIQNTNTLYYQNYSTALFIQNTNIFWIVFQEKYEVFRNLIKDNKYDNNKINKQYGQVYVFTKFQFASSHIYVSFYLTKKTFSGEKYKSVAALLVFLFRMVSNSSWLCGN